MTKQYELMCGDSLEWMPKIADSSIDSIVTDPPYGLKFMGKNWDHGIPGEAYWQEAFRVAKPGAHLLAFGGTRTFHRLTCAIEDAGWEIRDCIMWVYGSGFPKSLDVSKAIDKAAGVERDRYQRPAEGGTFSDDGGTTYGTALINTPETDLAKQWQGFGTALKPSWEPIIVARKPLIGTVVENILAHGTGALNIDACRVEGVDTKWSTKKSATGTFSQEKRPWKEKLSGKEEVFGGVGGRWPANLIHDGSNEVLDLFAKFGESKSSVSDSVSRKNGVLKHGGENSRPSHNTSDRVTLAEGYCDSGTAARFFYCAKASKNDRDEGCEELALRRVESDFCQGGAANPRDDGRYSVGKNHHPTVKPTKLMQYLCRLVTPPGGLILDPFCGSGTTGKAAMLEGFRFIGIELQSEYIDIARARIEYALRKMKEDDGLFSNI